jgi:tRNA threonylcarbamoyladenosine biosynthesis protein TsaB
LKIVALETSGQFCSIAVQVADRIYEKHEKISQQHAHVLLPWLADLLTKAKLNLTDLTAIAYSCGPGGFTGIRIGAAVVQALSLTQTLPVLAIPSLQIIAQGVYRHYGACEVIIIQDARMQQAYYGHYAVDKDGLMIAREPDQLLLGSQLESITINKSCFLVSDMSISMPEIMSLKAKAHQFIADYLPSAIDILSLSAARILAGDLTTADQALPIYLQSENTWKKLKEV